jgi:hypothetical protein
MEYQASAEVQQIDLPCTVAAKVPEEPRPDAGLLDTFENILCYEHSTFDNVRSIPRANSTSSRYTKVVQPVSFT